MRRVFISVFSLWATIFGFFAPSPLFAQQSTIVFSQRNQEVDSTIRRGRQLELERRWGDALTLYEDNLRQYPGDATLQARYDLSRLHYDLERRYVDRSFLDNLQRLPFSKALDLYSQVLLKLDSHYVDMPHWQELVNRGTNDLDVAFAEPSFVNRNVPAEKRSVAAPFPKELRTILATRTIKNRDDAREAVTFAASLAQQRLGVSPTAIVLEYLCGATNSLDQYSAFLTPDQLNEVYSQIEGNFVGVGIELKAQPGGLLIVRVIPGSPAEAAGIHGGDRILRVDNQDTTAMSTDQAANLLQGEEGTVVALVLAGSDNASKQLNIRRRRVDVPSIDQAMLVDREKGVAYIRLTCFQKTTARDLDTALWKLHREGMKSLIVDVRGNPGGLLISAVDTADRFLERGVIVSTHGRSAQEDAVFNAQADGTWQMPLVVIVDQDSASAAEIFAGAIRDLHRGTVVGVRSFGKGSVQGIFPLEGTSAGVRLTTAKFFSPVGRPYSQIGVEPDVVVRQAAKPTDGKTAFAPGDAQDVMLAAALTEIAHANSVQPALQARTAR